MKPHFEAACDHFASFLLGELDDDGSVAFLAHAKSCPDCRRDLEELWETHERLTLAATPSLAEELPPQFKQAVLEKAFSARPPTEGLWSIEAGGQPRTDAPGVRPPSDRRTASAFKQNRWKRLGSVVAVLAAFTLGIAIGEHGFGGNGKPTVALSQLIAEAPLTSTSASPPGARGMVMVVRTGAHLRVIVSVSHLTAWKRPTYFHVWLLHNGARRSAGVFTVNRSGDGALAAVVPVNLSFTAVGITVEPSPLGNVPRGPKVLGAQIGDG